MKELVLSFFSKGDADLNIVRAAIASARSQPTVVIGEDTDILILLTYYVDPLVHDLFFTTGKSGKGARCLEMKKFANKVPPELLDCLRILLMLKVEEVRQKCLILGVQSTHLQPGNGLEQHVDSYKVCVLNL